MRSDLIAALAVMLCGGSAHAITLGQIDDFQTGAQGWGIGMGIAGTVATPGPAGASDSYLEIGPSGTGMRVLNFNGSQWSGDYLAAGVGALHFDAINVGDTSVVLRAAIGDGGNGPMEPNSTWFVSTIPIVLPRGSGWVPVEISLDPADLTSVAGGASISSVLANVSAVRLLHSPGISALGGSNARFGVDNITAVPEPTIATTGTAAIVTTFALRRRRRRPGRAAKRTNCGR